MAEFWTDPTTFLPQPKNVVTRTNYAHKGIIPLHRSQAEMLNPLQEESGSDWNRSQCLQIGLFGPRPGDPCQCNNGQIWGETRPSNEFVLQSITCVCIEHCAPVYQLQGVVKDNVNQEFQPNVPWQRAPPPHPQGPTCSLGDHWSAFLARFLHWT